MISTKNFLVLIGGLLSVAVAAQSLPIRVEGNGYLRFIQNGKMVYAKSASLVAIQGRLGTADGAKLVPAIETNSVQGLSIGLSGQVKSGSVVLGQVVLAIFESNPQGSGNGGWIETAMRPNLGDPGDGENGVIRVAGTSNASAQKPVVREKGSLATDIKRNADPKILVITIPDSVEVESDAITLGDIVTMSGDSELAAKLSSLDLGTTPPLNVPRIIEQSKILLRIKSLGIDPRSVRFEGTAKTKVMRKGQVITHQQFVDSAIRGAQLKGYSQLQSTVPGSNFSAPQGELQLVCESVNASGSAISVTVAAYIDGKRFNSRTVKLESTLISLRPGTIVSVKVKSNAVCVELKGKVIKSDPTTGQVTVQIVDTGAQLIGVAKEDGSVEVKA